MNWRKFYLITFWIISILGLLNSIWLLVTEYGHYHVTMNYDLRPNITTRSVSSKLDICYPQPQNVTTVESVWSKTREASHAVKVVKMNKRFNSTVAKFTRGHLACYSIASNFGGGCPYSVPSGYIFEAEIEPEEKESEELRLFLYAPCKSMRSQYTQQIVLPRMYSGERKNLQVTISYSLIHRLHLPSPYYPHCSNFDERKVDKCLDRTVKEVFGNESESYFAQIHKRNNGTLKRNTRQSMWTCGYNRYEADCVQYIFVPKVQSVVPSSVDKIILIPEKTPVIFGVAEPSMTLLKLCGDILDSFVYWFAIAPIPYLVVEAVVNRILAQKYQSFQ